MSSRSNMRVKIREYEKRIGNLIIRETFHINELRPRFTQRKKALLTSFCFNSFPIIFKNYFFMKDSYPHISRRCTSLTFVFTLRVRRLRSECFVSFCVSSVPTFSPYLSFASFLQLHLLSISNIVCSGWCYMVPVLPSVLRYFCICLIYRISYLRPFSLMYYVVPYHSPLVVSEWLRLLSFYLLFYFFYFSNFLPSSIVCGFNCTPSTCSVVLSCRSSNRELVAPT